MLTGDLGLVDDDGYLHVTGRAKDVIIRGGVNISPLEIDSFLMQHPSLIEVATVGVPDGLWRGGGELRRGAAWLRYRRGYLLRYCSDGLPAFKAPKRIVLTAITAEEPSAVKLDRARPGGTAGNRDAGG
jgi:acyl-coenzyme A synthetase/AMP-(fatty) acid ligase